MFYNIKILAILQNKKKREDASSSLSLLIL